MRLYEIGLHSINLQKREEIAQSASGISAAHICNKLIKVMGKIQAESIKLFPNRFWHSQNVV